MQVGEQKLLIFVTFPQHSLQFCALSGIPKEDLAFRGHNLRQKPEPTALGTPSGLEKVEDGARCPGLQNIPSPKGTRSIARMCLGLISHKEEIMLSDGPVAASGVFGGKERKLLHVG